MTRMGELRDEWLKLRTVRAPWALLAASVVVILAGVAGVLLQQPGLSRRLTDATVTTALGHVGLVSVFALVVGVLISAGEFRYRTVVDTFLSTPQRSRVVVAKLVAGAGAGAVLGAVSAVAATAATALGCAAAGGSLDLTSGALWRTAAGGVAWCCSFGAIGVAVGAVVRNLAGALTAALAWVALVEGVLGQLLGDAGRWLPARSGTALGNVAAPGGGHPLTQAQGGLVLAVYTVLLGAGAVWATVARDVC